VLFAVCLSAIPARVATASPQFAEAFFESGGGDGYAINSLAIGDVNGDGKPDLVTVGGTTVSVLLSYGDGTFGPHTDFAIVGGRYSGAYSVAIGDLNGDGKPDLVTAGGDTSEVSVLLGHGDGTFEARTDYATEDFPGSVALGDLNQDGKLDLVVAMSSGLSVLLGNGDGTLGAGTNYATGGGGSVAVADVNGDGKPDLVAVSYSDVVSVLLGNGDGTFGASADFATGRTPFYVAVADLNGDGVPDLVTANHDGHGVSVLLGNGDGTFAVRTDYPTGTYPLSVAIRDLNGDGEPDLVIANQYSSAGYQSTVTSVLLGHGDGTFGASTDYETGVWTNFAAIEDLDGDGKPDVAVAGMAGVSVIRGVGDGTFEVNKDFKVGSEPTSVAIGDLNGDGRPDLVISDNDSGNGSTVSVLLGVGDGDFGAKTDFATGSGPWSAAIGELNGDGKPDLVTANFGNGGGSGSTVSVLLGHGDGSFDAKTDYSTGNGPRFVAIGDLNRDGKLDLVVAIATGLSVLLGNGDGTFGASAFVATGGGTASNVAMGDLNGDGAPDLVTVEFGIGGGSVEVLLGHGDGTFGAPTEYAAGNGPTFVAIADLNGDGIPDLATANLFGTASVLLGHGDGTFAMHADFDTRASAYSVAIGDLNGDGYPDLVTPSNASQISVLLGRGNETFGPPAFYGTGGGAYYGSYSVATGDLNGDGRPDVAVANLGANTVTVLLNTRATVSVPPARQVSRFELAAPRPNPFRSRATIDFAVPISASVRLDIYDVNGRRIQTLENGTLAPGRYSRSWDGLTATGSVAHAGMYLVRFSAPGIEQSTKTILIR
jgi:hypothetical protein